MIDGWSVGRTRGMWEKSSIMIIPTTEGGVLIFVRSTPLTRLESSLREGRGSGGHL